MRESCEGNMGDVVKCGRCGKEIRMLLIDRDEYVYKRGYKYFCSWKCMRAFDAEQVDKRRRRSERE